MADRLVRARFVLVATTAEDCGEVVVAEIITGQPTVPRPSEQLSGGKAHGA